MFLIYMTGRHPTLSLIHDLPLWTFIALPSFVLSSYEL